MNLTALRMFLLTAERGSLSEAARALDVTQSAVSKAIARLQEEHGVLLIETSSGRPSLTPAGQNLLPLARKLLELETLAEDCLSSFSRGEAISILCSETFGVYFLPPVLSRMRAEWPGTRVRMELAHNSRIEERIAGCEHEVGIVSRPGRHPSLDYFHLLDDELVLICHPAHALAGTVSHASNLAREPFVLHEPGSVPRLLAEELFLRHGLAPEVQLEVSNVETMKAAVRERVGLAFLSRRSCRNELEQGALAVVGIADERLVRSFHFVRHRDRPESPSMRRLYHCIKDLP